MSKHLPQRREGFLPAPMNVLARSYGERGLVKHAKALQRRALEIRLEDAARLYVASGRLVDIRDLTRGALHAGGEIGDCLATEVQARPFFVRELSSLASAGAFGLKHELEYYIREGH